MNVKYLKERGTNIHHSREGDSYLLESEVPSQASPSWINSDGVVSCAKKSIGTKIDELVYSKFFFDLRKPLNEYVLSF